jgi:hypothetical protein
MSIPTRIWRILRGRWLMADDEVREALAEELAAHELAEGSRPQLESGAAIPGTSRLPASAAPRRPAPAGSAHDPLAADLALLGAPPACDMPTLDRVYQERLAELEQQTTSPADLDALAARRTTLAEAYERLRDAINTTETRFEKLEF